MRAWNSIWFGVLLATLSCSDKPSSDESPAPSAANQNRVASEAQWTVLPAPSNELDRTGLSDLINASHQGTPVEGAEVELDWIRLSSTNAAYGIAVSVLTVGDKRLLLLDSLVGEGANNRSRRRVLDVIRLPIPPSEMEVPRTCAVAGAQDSLVIVLAPPTHDSLYTGLWRAWTISRLLRRFEETSVVGISCPNEAYGV